MNKKILKKQKRKVLRKIDTRDYSDFKQLLINYINDDLHEFFDYLDNRSDDYLSDDLKIPEPKFDELEVEEVKKFDGFLYNFMLSVVSTFFIPSLIPHTYIDQRKNKRFSFKMTKENYHIESSLFKSLIENYASLMLHHRGNFWQGLFSSEQYDEDPELILDTIIDCAWTPAVAVEMLSGGDLEFKSLNTILEDNEYYIEYCFTKRNSTERVFKYEYEILRNDLKEALINIFHFLMIDYSELDSNTISLENFNSKIRQ